MKPTRDAGTGDGAPHIYSVDDNAETVEAVQPLLAQPSTAQTVTTLEAGSADKALDGDISIRRRVLAVVPLLLTTAYIVLTVSILSS